MAPNIDNAYVELLTEFDVEAELLRQNLSELLGQLVDNGLLRIHSADVESAPAI
jgi:DNA-binding LytR/AlgR family response regulator